MGEIRVHLDDQVSALLDGIGKTGDIGRTQSQLASPVQDVYAFRVPFDQIVGDLAGTVRRVVIHDQDFYLWKL